MVHLPPIPKLIQRTKALAALDLILSPEWESRYYSFNSRWSPDEQMASMRNGSGDEWWLVFHKSGWAALKGLDHELARAQGGAGLSIAIQSVFPPELKDFAQEPAFQWSETSFAYYSLADSFGWKRANDLTTFADNKDTGEEYLLRHLTGSPEDYVSFVEEYYEKTVPIEIVTSVFALEPINDSLVGALNPDVSLKDISAELFGELSYPTL